MNSHTITMRALDGMGFRKRYHYTMVSYHYTMVSNFGEYDVIVYFPENMLGGVGITKGMDSIRLSHVKTIDDIKLLYRVLTGEDWKG